MYSKTADELRKNDIVSINDNKYIVTSVNNCRKGNRTGTKQNILDIYAVNMDDSHVNSKFC